MSPVIGRRGKTHLRPIFHQLHHAHHQTTCQAHLVVWPSGLRRGQLTMVVKIRLARFGRRNSPFYNIVVAHARYTPALPLSSAFVDPRANFNAARRATPARSRSSARTTPSPSPTPTTAPALCTRTSSSTLNARDTGSASAPSLPTRPGGCSRWWASCPRRSSVPRRTKRLAKCRQARFAFDEQRVEGQLERNV